MIVRETRDIDEIRSILCDPAIYDTITADDSCKANEFTPPLEDHKYFGGYIDNEIFGLMVYHMQDELNLCHVQVLKSHRAAHAREFGFRVLAERGDEPLYAIIPDCYENVLEFAKGFGFEIIGKNRASYTKNGITYDDNVLRLGVIKWDS